MQKNKVAIYCRLSDEDRHKKSKEDESESIQNQKNMLTLYAIENGWEIYKIYCDEDLSGINSNRPEYRQLLDDAQAKKFNIVLCKTQSRFTRDMIEVDVYIHNKFPEWGIRFISVVDNVDTNVKGNKKTRQINALIHEWYLEEVSENIKAVLNSKKKQGKFIGSFAPYGYIKDPQDKSHLIIDKEAASIVKRIFDMYLSGKSHIKIARTLNSEKVPSPMVYMQEVIRTNFKIESNRIQTRIWAGSSVSRILNNRMYVGDMVQSRYRILSYKNPVQVRQDPKDWIIVPNTHDAIIDREKFEMAGEIAKSRTRPDRHGEVSKFGGKLKCAECGGTLSKGAAFDRKTGEYTLIVYRCDLKKKQPEMCLGSSIVEHNLEKHVITELKQIIAKLTSVGDIASLVTIEKQQEDSIKDLRKRLAKKKSELDRREKAIAALYLDKAEGMISIDEFTAMHAIFMKESAELKESIEKITKEMDEIHNENTKLEDALEREKAKRDMVEKYLDISSLTREIIVELIDYIIIKNLGWRNKSIEIHWRF